MLYIEILSPKTRVNVAYVCERDRAAAQFVSSFGMYFNSTLDDTAKRGG